MHPRQSQPIVTQKYQNESCDAVELGSATSVKMRRQRVLRRGSKENASSKNFDDRVNSYLNSKSNDNSMERNTNDRYSDYGNDANNVQNNLQNNLQKNNIQSDDISNQFNYPIKVKRNSSRQSRNQSQNSSQMKITDYNEINVDSNYNTQNSQPRKILRESPIKVNNPNMNLHNRPSLRSRGSNESNLEGDKSY